MGYIAVSESTKRWVVFVIAAAMTVIAVMDLLHVSTDIFSIVVSSLMVVGSAFGAYGAYKMSAGHLGWFLIVVTVLIVLQAVSLILALAHHASFRTFVWNIIDLMLLFILAGFTADLRSDSALSLGGPYSSIA